MVVEAPALDLLQHLVELRARDRAVDEALAAREAAEVPGMEPLELGRNGDLPKMKVLAEPGDVVELEVEKIGLLRNRVVR